MFRRRRPLLRAAAIGGGAYFAGKRVARHRAERDQQEAYQDQRLNDLEYSQAAQPAAPAAPAAPAEDPTTAKLKELAALHSQGVLTDEEFSAAKAKLLGI